VIIPHGLYDLARNQGWIHLGLSRDTTAFACDSLRLFWHSDGRRLYPNASAILLLCDGGGSNSCHKHLFKEDLQELVNDLKVPIRMAHYPAYCSKFNPIERRLFSHVTRACQGVLFDSLQTVMGLIQKTKTQQGLSVTVRVLDTLYEGGRTVSEAFKKNMPIVFDTVLPKMELLGNASVNVKRGIILLPFHHQFWRSDSGGRRRDGHRPIGRHGRYAGRGGHQ